MKTSLKEIKKDRRKNLGKYPLNVQIIAKISHIPAYVFINWLPFTGNQITLFWMFLGLLGCLIMALGGYFNLLVGILIYHIVILLDFVDGRVAKSRKKMTIGGLWMDMFFDYFLRGFLLLALGLGIYNSTGQIIYFYLGMLSGFLLTYDHLMKLKVYEMLLVLKKHKILNQLIQGAKKNKDGLLKGESSKIKNLIKELLKPDAPFSFMFFAILFNIPKYYLLLISVLIPVFFIKNFINLYKKIGNKPLK